MSSSKFKCLDLKEFPFKANHPLVKSQHINPYHKFNADIPAGDALGGFPTIDMGSTGYPVSSFQKNDSMTQSHQNISIRRVAMRA